MYFGMKTEDRSQRTEEGKIPPWKSLPRLGGGDRGMYFGMKTEDRRMYYVLWIIGDVKWVEVCSLMFGENKGSPPGRTYSERSEGGWVRKKCD